MEHIQERARLWLADRGIKGKVIAQRLYEDRYVVVLDSGHKIDIPLDDMVEQEAMPTPEPPPVKPKRKPRRRRSKANG